LDTKEKVKYWLGQLCEELEERLTKDKDSVSRQFAILAKLTDDCSGPSQWWYSPSSTPVQYQM
jgi:hypothetical protein